MTVRREAIREGDRELHRTATRFGDEFRAIRRRANVSQAAVARAIDVDPSAISRLESGDIRLGNDIRARAAAVIGADFRLQLYPERVPMLHDAAHARLVERLLALLHPTWTATLEAPIPGAGRRSVDVLLRRGDERVIAEVETRVQRLEEIVRELHGKREQLAGADVLLVLPPTRHHRTLVAAHP